jgi:hypothetical protein
MILGEGKVGARPLGSLNVPTDFQRRPQARTGHGQDGPPDRASESLPWAIHQEAPSRRPHLPVGYSSIRAPWQLEGPCQSARA